MGLTGIKIGFFSQGRLLDRLLVTAVFALAFLATLQLMLPAGDFRMKFQLALYLFVIAAVLMEGGHALFGPAQGEQPRDFQRTE